MLPRYAMTGLQIAAVVVLLIIGIMWGFPPTQGGNAIPVLLGCAAIAVGGYAYYRRSCGASFIGGAGGSYDTAGGPGGYDSAGYAFGGAGGSYDTAGGPGGYDTAGYAFGGAEYDTDADYYLDVDNVRGGAGCGCSAGKLSDYLVSK